VAMSSEVLEGMLGVAFLESLCGPSLRYILLQVSNLLSKTTY